MVLPIDPQLASSHHVRLSTSIVVPCNALFQGFEYIDIIDSDDEGHIVFPSAHLGLSHHSTSLEFITRAYPAVLVVSVHAGLLRWFQL